MRLFFLFCLSLLIGNCIPGIADEGDFIVETENILKEVEIKPDKALVYVFRPQEIAKAIKIWTFVGQELLIVTKSDQGGYFYLEPGKHLFWSKAENIDVREIELEAGKAYYIKQVVEMGLMKARTSIELLDKKAAIEKMEQCKIIQNTDAAKARAAELINENWTDVQEKLQKKAAKSTDKEDKKEK